MTQDIIEGRVSAFFLAIKRLGKAMDSIFLVLETLPPVIGIHDSLDFVKARRVISTRLGNGGCRDQY